MANNASKNPFSRLDTSLMRSTKSPAQQETSLQGDKETRKLVNKETVKQVYQETRKRALYPKMTYQLNPDVLDALEDAKRTLKRQYKLKVSLAEIVEEAIRHMSQDLQENKETSKLVIVFTRKPEIQNS